jgi:hypothetical protein
MSGASRLAYGEMPIPPKGFSAIITDVHVATNGTKCWLYYLVPLEELEPFIANYRYIKPPSNNYISPFDGETK